MSSEAINIEEIIGDKKPTYVPIDKCNSGEVQMRQSGTKVNKDDKLVEQIRKSGGLLHPIILKKENGDTYEILVGQRRTGAYHILKEEDPKYEKIRAYVIDRELSDDEKRVISFIENFGRDDASKSDYINVIEYFYMKYNGNQAMTANALGITAHTVKKYLTHARLSDRVKKHISDQDFTIDTAMKALKGLGDDESSVDENDLIETAKELHNVKPLVRSQAVKIMQSKRVAAKEAIEDSKIVKELKIGMTEYMMNKLTQYKDKHEYGSDGEAAGGAIERELDRDTD